MPISFSIDPFNVTCDGPRSGQLLFDPPVGGIGPYEYSLDITNWQTEPSLIGLEAGNYTAYVRDLNECISETDFSLFAPEIPEVRLGDDEILALGDSIRLNGIINNLTSPDVSWTPEAFLSCVDCLDPYARPPNSVTYVVTVESQDGCIDQDSIQIDVQKFRRFFAPNAFSPNQDGSNDLFNIQGGPEVAFIEKLQIYDRWGSLVYEESQLISNTTTNGWDGRMNGKNLNAGIFVWFASIRFIDGEVLDYSGELVLMR